MTIKRIDVGPRMSQAVIANGQVFISGQIGSGATVERQTSDILSKVDDLLAQASSSRSQILSVNIWLSDISDFAEMNGVWDSWIDVENPPARACVQSQLAFPELKVEIAVVAQVHDQGE